MVNGFMKYGGEGMLAMIWSCCAIGHGKMSTRLRGGHGVEVNLFKKGAKADPI